MLAGVVKFQRTRLSNSIWALENPILPGAEAGEYFGFHGFGTDETERGFHAGQGVRGEACPLLNGQADFILPIDITGGKGHQPQIIGRLGIQILADFGLHICLRAIIAQKAGG